LTQEAQEDRTTADRLTFNELFIVDVTPALATS
jgi:hypothetical protein